MAEDGNGGHRRQGDASGAGAGGERRPPRHRRVLLTLLLLSCAAYLVLASGPSALGTLGFVSVAFAGEERGLGPLVDAARTAPSRALSGAVNRLRGPARVGIQIGHEAVHDHPDELAALRTNTGGHWRGVNEIDVNRRVAAALAERLRASGVRVDLLPATVPRGYHADALVSLHADSSPDETRRGYKSAHFEPARNRLEPALKGFIDAAYLARSALPDDDRNVSGSMLRYYAFNARRYRHSVHPGTPALIVELGYISNPHDLAFLERPDAVADALHAGIIGYLEHVGRWTAAP